MINVSVKQVDGGEIQFKIKRKTKMKKLMDAWCQKKVSTVQMPTVFCGLESTSRSQRCGSHAVVVVADGDESTVHGDGNRGGGDVDYDGGVDDVHNQTCIHDGL